MKFEEKVKLLEQYISELEKDDVDLDNAIEKYTEAMKLVKECDKELKNIEAKVTKIVSQNNEEKDFEIEWLLILFFVYFNKNGK